MCLDKIDVLSQDPLSFWWRTERDLQSTGRSLRCVSCDDVCNKKEEISISILSVGGDVVDARSDAAAEIFSVSFALTAMFSLFLSHGRKK